MTEHLELLRATVRDAASAAAGPGDELAATRTLWRSLDEVGVAALGVPEERGGSGGSLGDALVVLEELGAAAVSTPYLESCLLGAWLCAAAGIATPAGMLAASHGPGLTVDGAPADGASVSGRVPDVRWASAADRLVAVAWSGREPRVVVLGPTQFGTDTTAGVDGVPTDIVTVTGAPVRGEQIGTVTVAELDAVRVRGALGTACLMAGAMRRALDLAVEHASVREQFGRPVLEFQAVKHALVAAAAESHLADVCTQRAVALSTHEPDPVATAVAKVRVARAAGVVARVAHQVHGAMGLTEEHPLWRFTTRLWTHRDRYGSRTDWERELGRLVRGSDRFWSLLTAEQPRSV